MSDIDWDVKMFCEGFHELGFRLFEKNRGGQLTTCINNIHVLSGCSRWLKLTFLREANLRLILAPAEICKDVIFGTSVFCETYFPSFLCLSPIV